MMNTIDILENRVGMLEGLNSNYLMQIDGLEFQVKQLKTQYASVPPDWVHQDAYRAAHVGRLDAEARVARLETEVSRLQDEAAKDGEAHLALRYDVTEYESLLAAHQEAIRERDIAQADLDVCNQIRDEYFAKVNELSRSLDQARADGEEARSDYWAECNSKAKLHEDIATLESRVVVRDEEIAKLTGELASHAEDTRVTGKQTKAQLQLKLNTVSAMFDDLQERYNVLDQSHARLSRSNQLIDVVKAENKNVVKLTEQRAEIGILQERVRHLSGALDQTQYDLGRCQDELHEANSKLVETPLEDADEEDSQNTRRLINELYHNRSLLEKRLKHIGEAITAMIEAATKVRMYHDEHAHHLVTTVATLNALVRHDG